MLRTWKHKRRTAAIARQQRRPGRQAAARGSAHDRQTIRVDTQRARIRCQPDQTGIAILDTGRERVFGSQPVVDRHDDGLDRGSRLRRAQMLGLDAAEAESTPVKVEDGRERAGGVLGMVDAHANLGPALRSRNHAVFVTHAGRLGLLTECGADHLEHLGPRGGQVRPVGFDGQAGDQRSELRVVASFGHRISRASALPRRILPVGSEAIGFSWAQAGQLMVSPIRSYPKT
jgi:hypothetical protein